MYIEIKIVSDGDGHEYVIPVTFVERFNRLLDNEDYDKLEEEFGKYSIGGCPSQVKLYTKQSDIFTPPGLRRSGRTTRIIDEAIQILFDKGEVVVKDHYDSREATIDVIKKIHRRIEMEHPLIKDIIEIDPIKFIIRFKKSYIIK